MASTTGGTLEWRISEGLTPYPEALAAMRARVEAIRAGLLRVIEDAGRRDELIARGYENARRFRTEAVAAQYLQVYREICAAS